jgi:hypothetical protein
MSEVKGFPCPHCGGEKICSHCDNDQCSWIRCLNPQCKRVSVTVTS